MERSLSSGAESESSVDRKRFHSARAEWSKRQRGPRISGSLGECREAGERAAIGGVQSVFGGDNGPLMVAPRFKFNARKSIGCATGGPGPRGSNEWEGSPGVRGGWEVCVF